jgi:hypothetical protein
MRLANLTQTGRLLVRRAVLTRWRTATTLCMVVAMCGALSPLAAQEQTPRTLGDLLNQADAPREVDPLRFRLPSVEPAELAARGIRLLRGEHVDLYTDLPAQPEIEELPRVFDAAVPQWASYFGIDPARTKPWRVSVCLAADPGRFAPSGLWPQDLPRFLHGYARQGECWLHAQESAYYTRHLLLHEGTHAFMLAWLGSLGPAGYAEGMAELFGTHRWEEGTLQTRVVPRSREEAPLWGRIKVIREAWQQRSARSLAEVTHTPHEAFLQTPSYAWAWGVAAFFDQSPERSEAFRSLRSVVSDTTPTFATRLWNKFPDPRGLGEEWQWYLANLDYGYDIPRETFVRLPSAPWTKSAIDVQVAADRGWQSTGLALMAGDEVQLTAAGEFRIAQRAKEWMCTADGVTLRYYRGEPLGKLLAAVTDEGLTEGPSPLLSPQAVGATGTVRCERSGVLYLRVNDHPAELAENQGHVLVRVAKP